MTESAEQRTKRRFREYLNLTAWAYQYSVFYQCAGDARACALGDATRFKEKLRRKAQLKSQPFLYRLCLYRANAYHTIFTTDTVDVALLESMFHKISEAEIKVRGRELPPWKIENYSRAVGKQKPHDLSNFFGDRKINRIALLNCKALNS